MSSVIQVLFHLPSFHRRYWEEGKRHAAECRNGRPADCFACQMHKVADGIFSGKYALVPSEEQLEDARREREEREREKERAKSGAMDVDQPDNGPSRAVKRKKQVSDLPPLLPSLLSQPSLTSSMSSRSPLRLPQLQPGVPPRMFKRLVAKGHAEFSGGKQQDALEFWHYFVDHVKQKEHVNRVDPADIFNFQQQVGHALYTAMFSAQLPPFHCYVRSVDGRPKRCRCEGRVERLSISAPTDLKSAPGTVRVHLS